MMNAPLADLMRPQTIDEVVGQKPHSFQRRHPLPNRPVRSRNQPDLLRTARHRKNHRGTHHRKAGGQKLYKLNGTTASTADFKEIISSLDTFEGMNGVVLYLDEIQYLNKKQQQTLLEFLENGQITLIASTTENPYFLYLQRHHQPQHRL